MGQTKAARTQDYLNTEHNNIIRKDLAVTLLRHSLDNTNDSRSKSGLVKDAIRLLM